MGNCVIISRDESKEILDKIKIEKQKEIECKINFRNIIRKEISLIKNDVKQSWIYPSYIFDFKQEENEETYKILVNLYNIGLCRLCRYFKTPNSYLLLFYLFERYLYENNVHNCGIELRLQLKILENNLGINCDKNLLNSKFHIEKSVLYVNIEPYSIEENKVKEVSLFYLQRIKKKDFHIIFKGLRRFRKSISQKYNFILKTPDNFSLKVNRENIIETFFDSYRSFEHASFY